MKNDFLLAVSLASSLVVSMNSATAWATPESDQAFALAEKLEAAQPWTVDKVIGITGLPLNGRGYGAYLSEDHPDFKPVRQVGLTVKSNKGKYWIRDVALRMPETSNVQLADAVTRYGLPKYIDGRRQLFRRKHQWLAVTLDSGTRVKAIELLRRRNVATVDFGPTN